MRASASGEYQPFDAVVKSPEVINENGRNYEVTDEAADELSSNPLKFIQSGWDLGRETSATYRRSLGTEDVQSSSVAKTGAQLVISPQEYNFIPT